MHAVLVESLQQAVSLRAHTDTWEGTARCGRVQADSKCGDCVAIALRLDERRPVGRSDTQGVAVTTRNPPSGHRHWYARCRD